MNKKLLILGLLIVANVGVIWAQSSALPITLTPAVTALAANSTNTTAGTAIMIPNTKESVRIWVSANGVQATTNGTLIVKFSTASGTYTATNEWDNAPESTVKVTLSTLGAATNSALPLVKYTGSETFDLSGVRYIRAGQIENGFAGVVSNITIRLGHQE